MLTLPRFEWIQPRTLDELLAHLAAHPGDSLLVAGGTDAVPNLKHRLHEPRYLVHIGRVAELRFVRDEADGLHLGPLVTLTRLAAEPVVRRDFPALARAASLVAGPQLRNMGTLGGNLCLDTRCTYYNQTYFWREALGFCLKKDGVHCHVVPQGKRCVAAHSADTPPMLIALGAEVEIRSAGGARTTPVEGFFVADGIHNNVLRPGEVVTRIFLPARARRLTAAYQKLRPRAAIDFPMLSVAFAARVEDGRCSEARLVVSALAAKPRLVGGLEAIVKDRALDEHVIDRLAQTAYQQCKPVINVAYDDDYRHEMVPVFVRRAVREALGLPPRVPGWGGGMTAFDVWETLARWRTERRRFVLASVIESRGFTPRKPGAHMLVADGAICGTIGGGAIEQQVLDEARALLASGGGVAVVKKHLTQELGMCCGGEMSVFLEVVAPAPRLYLFGAGYIARPLAALAAGCGFEVTVVDGRADWATAERFPACGVRCQAAEDFLRDLETTAEDYAVVVTHDHALDQRIVQDLLRRPLAFVGMIGSVPKQRKFALRLRARGFSVEQIGRLRTPLGMPIGAETPEEIAVSAMGEIIAARRGASVREGWTPPLPQAQRERLGTQATAPQLRPSAPVEES